MLGERSSELSPRELDVLKLVGQGKTNKQIALELGIKEGTVKLHVMHIYDKKQMPQAAGRRAQLRAIGQPLG